MKLALEDNEEVGKSQSPLSFSSSGRWVSAVWGEQRALLCEARAGGKPRNKIFSRWSELLLGSGILGLSHK